MLLLLSNLCLSLLAPLLPPHLPPFLVPVPVHWLAMGSTSPSGLELTMAVPGLSSSSGSGKLRRPRPASRDGILSVIQIQVYICTPMQE